MSASVDVRAPDEQTEGTRSQVLRWLKQVGESVAENEPLVELETDKVTVELAAPLAGVLREILKQEQEEIVPGEVLARIESGSIAAQAAPEAVAVVPAAGRASASAAPRERRPPGALSPAVQRLLAERGLAPGEVEGTGPLGRIMVGDVLRAVPAAAPAMAPERAPAAGTDGAGVRRVPHTVIRRRIAEHMVQSLLKSAPHVTTVFEADLARVLAHRERSRAPYASEGVPLTLSAYFVRAAVAALEAVPEANSRWTEEALEIYAAKHIGIATAVEGSGLVVPVLHHAESLDLKATARALDDLVQRARAGTLTPADVRGGTFTISNHGVSGSLLAAPIVINQPQAAILGIGKLERRVVALEDGGLEQLAVRPRCYVTLTLDHRVMDGQQANRFLEVFVATLAEWPEAP